ncbi:MAG TPA: SgcJ/EcaC family oxidoreductase [Candidatus Acidoferrales bacterium]
MRRKLLGVAVLILVAACTDATWAGPPDHAQDEAQIRAVEMRLQDAWNSHDMKAWANQFTEDADFVNVVGWWWQGRAQIESKHAKMHQSMFKDSTLAVGSVTIRFIGPDTAIVHMLWTLEGAKNFDGGAAGERKGIFTEVLVRQGNDWLISAAQNTDKVPEPAAPPSADAPRK